MHLSPLTLKLNENGTGASADSPVAGTQEQFATLSLGSLAHDYHGTIEIQLVPPNGSTGTAVTVTNLQQFTIPS